MEPFTGVTRRRGWPLRLNTLGIRSQNGRFSTSHCMRWCLVAAAGWFKRAWLRSTQADRLWRKHPRRHFFKAAPKSIDAPAPMPAEFRLRCLAAGKILERSRPQSDHLFKRNASACVNSTLSRCLRDQIKSKINRLEQITRDQSSALDGSGSSSARPFR